MTLNELLKRVDELDKEASKDWSTCEGVIYCGEQKHDNIIATVDHGKKGMFSRQDVCDARHMAEARTLLPKLRKVIRFLVDRIETEDEYPTEVLEDCDRIAGEE